jgi:hypothetical protein
MGRAALLLLSSASDHFLVEAECSPSSPSASGRASVRLLQNQRDARAPPVGEVFCDAGNLLTFVFRLCCLSLVASHPASLSLPLSLPPPLRSRLLGCTARPVRRLDRLPGPGVSARVALSSSRRFATLPRSHPFDVSSPLAPFAFPAQRRVEGETLSPWRSTRRQPRSALTTTRARIPHTPFPPSLPSPFSLRRPRPSPSSSRPLPSSSKRAFMARRM